MRKLIKRFFVVLVIIAVIGSLISNAQTDPEANIVTDGLSEMTDLMAGVPESSLPDNIYDVIRVVDGDTIVINDSGEETKIRLIGINTPETSGENACEEGEVAKRITTDLLNGERVTLEFDEDSYDDYGRTLAYVYLEDGTMLNSLLLKKGYAEVMTIEPNTKYKVKFEADEYSARFNGVGFWGAESNYFNVN